MRTIEYGDPAADIVLVQPVGEHELAGIETELAEIRARTKKAFRLIAAAVEDWNADLSPWAAPAVFGDEAFAGRAADTLQAIRKLCEEKEKTYYIGGYSLAGLFALWAAHETDRFAGVAAASPSVWFPGFPDYLRRHGIRSAAVYLSLGTKEEKVRDPVLASVGDRIREAKDLLSERGIRCTLEWNPGNHFRDAALRTAKAFAWVMEQPAETDARETFVLRPARPEDAPRIGQIFEQARRFQLAQGFAQWSEAYPTARDALDDIAKARGYVFCAGEAVCGYCCIEPAGEKFYEMPMQPNPAAGGAGEGSAEGGSGGDAGASGTRRYSEPVPAQVGFEGRWLADGRYAVVHRMAIGEDFRDRRVSRDFFRLIAVRCRDLGVVSIRIDTHEANRRMQHVLAREGFVPTGRVCYPECERLAYELPLER